MCILKIGLKYRKDGRLNNAVLSLNKKMIEHLDILSNDITLIFKNKNVILQGGETTTAFEKIENGKIIELVKNLKIQQNKKIYLPLGILNELNINLEKDENYVEYELINDNKIRITLKESIEQSNKEKELKAMGEIITVKVNKGGVGKTFVTLQLGSYLALQGKKVLLLTSDSQNNIIDYAGKNKDVIGKGLKEFVKSGKGDLIKLRKDLYFIPLESSTFGTQFLLKLPAFLEKMKLEYDYIIIDSIPTMKIDTVFVKCSDRLIIPCFCDKVTVEGAINVINEAGADKVLAIIINKYENKKIQNIFKEEITEAIKDTNILFPNPIVNTSEVEMLLFKGKTIWESKAKKVLEIQESFKTIGDYLLNNNVIDETNEFDINF